MSYWQLTEDELTNEVHYVLRDLLKEQDAAVGGVYLTEGYPSVLEHLRANIGTAPGIVP